MSGSRPTTPQLAAGAVVWRRVGDQVRILLIHRGGHRDVSLPKGKIDPGETPPQAAVREIREETGLPVHLGVPLGTSEYTLPGGRPKVVYYWAAHVKERHATAPFTPNDEVELVEWVTPEKAAARLTYERDVDVVNRFADYARTGMLDSFALIALRHAKATPRGDFDGPDDQRPLTKEGERQAAAIAPTLASWGPKRIISSPAVRCLQTVTPLTTLTDRTVRLDEGISQDAWEAGDETVAATVAKRIAKGKGAVICSHGPVLPDILLEIARQSGGEVSRELQRAAALGVGDFAVLHIADDHGAPRLIAVERYGPGSIV